ncbi:MAG: O-antigen ligase family protein, partial [Candidatus Shapirobacteria bacterium]|nr:O-antigen ligase family protein [Candidatus Shapirobacteria bacterium]
KNKSKKVVLLLLFVACYYLLILTASRVSFIAYLVSLSFLFIILNKKWWLPPIIALSLLGSFFSEDINQRFSATIKIEGPRVVQKMNRTIQSLLPEREEKKIAQINPTPTPVIVEEGEEIKEEVSSGPTTGKITPKLTPEPTPTSEPSQQEMAEIGVERSGDIRFGVEWPRAIRHFKKSPLLGTGYSSITLATDNGYLRALGETGFLGFLSLLTIFLAQIPLYQSLLKKTKTNPQIRFFAAAMASGTLAILTSMLFIDALESSKVAFTYWLILGLFVGRVNLEKKETGHE